MHDRQAPEHGLPAELLADEILLAALVALRITRHGARPHGAVGAHAVIVDRHDHAAADDADGERAALAQLIEGSRGVLRIGQRERDLGHELVRLQDVALAVGRGQEFVDVDRALAADALDGDIGVERNARGQTVARHGRLADVAAERREIADLGRAYLTAGVVENVDILANDVVGRHFRMSRKSTDPDDAVLDLDVIKLLELLQVDNDSRLCLPLIEFQRKVGAAGNASDAVLILIQQSERLDHGGRCVEIKWSHARFSPF